MTHEELIEKVARELSGHFGPSFDDLPASNAECRALRREGKHFNETQDSMLNAAREAIRIVIEACGDEVAKERVLSENYLTKLNTPYSRANESSVIASLEVVQNRIQSLTQGETP